MVLESAVCRDSSVFILRIRWLSSRARFGATTRWRGKCGRGLLSRGCGSCFEQRKQVTTFGPYSPGQAVTMKRMGTGGHLPGRVGNVGEAARSMRIRGPDLASYPLSQVPDEAAGLVRALLAADKNQHFARARMTDAAAQGDSGCRLQAFHHCRRGHRDTAAMRTCATWSAALLRLECRATTSKTRSRARRSAGTRAGRCWLPQDEQIRRLNAARLQLDIMRVPGNDRELGRMRSRRRSWRT
jgi:isocitrate lyase